MTPEIRATVRAELDSAFDGGQFEPGGYLYEGPDKVISPEELALDLVTFSPALGGFGVGEVRPFVDGWLCDNDAKLREAARG